MPAARPAWSKSGLRYDPPTVRDGEQAVESGWVLHTPYAAPDRHWELDEHGRAKTSTAPGRRPSSTQLPVPNPRGDDSDWTPPDPTLEPHRTINELRELVDDWRTASWKGATPRVRLLLEDWAAERAEMRPFWCQREAVETLIWLFDAGPVHAPDRHATIVAGLGRANRRWNDGIARVATKMATGTGKTHLMAMIALWWAVRHPDGPVDLLALAPGLTIRDRLQVLRDPNDEIWRSVAPPGFQGDVKRMRWTILNFQAFQRKSVLQVDGKAATGKEKNLLYGPRRGRKERQTWIESEREMLDRLLKAHRGGGPIAVLNDEAHHCYTLQDVRLTTGRVDAEEREDRKRAELWFGALRALRAAGRLGQVFDLSATPMWLRRPAQLQAETFPWTVSDFSLLDAVESGLVKVPRVPVDDRAMGADGKPVHIAPRYRNVYLHNEKRALGQPLAPQVAEPLHELYDHYAEETTPAYEERGRTPVLIVVGNTIENATALHRYIAGYRETMGDDEDNAPAIWKAGNLALFSNADPATGRPVDRPPTILVHSRLDDPASGGNDAIGKAIEDQAALFGPAELDTPLTRPEKQQAIRDVFMSVGRRGGPGEHIRCVISVGMLTEGWDARNVTHIFGYRAFGSQLLCEQVTGRALRKTAFSGRDEKQPIEYANLFGVPFAWPGGKTPGTPPVPIEPQDVYTLPGREHLRLTFPHLAGYARGDGAPSWRIDPRDAPRGRVASRGALIGTSVEGPLGDPVLVPRQAEDERTALWKAAAQLVPKLEGGVEDRRQAFLDSLAILDLCRPNLDCEDWTDLQFDGDTLHEIASRVQRLSKASPASAPCSTINASRAPRGRVDTGAVRFRTTLRYWYDDSAKSELNAAACHSKRRGRACSDPGPSPGGSRRGSGTSAWAGRCPGTTAATPAGRVRSRTSLRERKLPRRTDVGGSWSSSSRDSGREKRARSRSGATLKNAGRRPCPARARAAATTSATGAPCGSRMCGGRVSRSRGRAGADRAVEARRDKRGEGPGCRRSRDRTSTAPRRARTSRRTGTRPSSATSFGSGSRSRPNRSARKVRG